MRRFAGGLSLVLLAVSALPFNGCSMSAQTSKTSAKGDVFAADREAPAEPVAFDSKRAMSYLEALCKIGPRQSGTEGMKKQQEMLEKHFKEHGGKITWQRFTARQRSVRKDVEMANLIVSWHPDRPRRVILCSHYDTRPLADREENVRNWRKPFLSANDGGSGVALLMELAHFMKDLKVQVGVDFVFFDGEEYIFEQDDEYFFGSKHFGREYRRGRDKTYYGAAILLDMVGGKKAQFPVEPYSWDSAPALVRAVWAIAEEFKCESFNGKEFGERVQDDHVPLNQSGIPAIDIIDFKYPHWHRLTDLPENCSGETLEQVAKVLSVWLQRVK